MKEQFQITLEPMPGNYHPVAARRLAGLLKALGRKWGLRCVSARAVSGDTPIGVRPGKEGEA